MNKNRIFINVLLVTFFMGCGPAQAAGLTLQDLIMQATTSYPDVLARQSDQNAASNDLLASKLRWLPAVTIGKQNNNVAFSNGTSGYLPSTSFQASIPVFTFGGDWATYKKAKADLSVADYSLMETRADITRKVINAYSEWYKSYLKCLALEYAKKQSEQLVVLITRRYEAGIAPLSEQSLGISRLEQAKADLEDQLTNEKKSLAVLAQLAGQPISRADLVGSVARPLKAPPRDDILNNALEYNPTVNKVKQQAESSERAAEVARAQALPQISFQAQRQIGNSYAPGYPGYNALGLVLQYQGGGGFAGVATTFSAYDKSKTAAIVIETSKRDLTTTVNTDYDSYESGISRVKSLTEAEALTNSVSQSYDRQYLIGKKGWIDLLNSIRDTVIAKSNLADAKGNLIGSSWRLITYSDGNINWDDARK